MLYLFTVIGFIVVLVASLIAVAIALLYCWYLGSQVAVAASVFWRQFYEYLADRTAYREWLRTVTLSDKRRELPGYASILVCWNAMSAVEQIEAVNMWRAGQIKIDRRATASAAVTPSNATSRSKC